MLPSVKDANSHFNKGQYAEALTCYLRLQETYPELEHILDLNIKLCKKSILKTDVKSSALSPQISITLTTISERLNHLMPVLESLHNQTLQPQRIYLNVSEEPYLLDKGIKRDDPRLESLSRLPLLTINWTRNTGPYRKIIPFMERHFSDNPAEQKLFITADDDTLYPEYFVQSLFESHLEHDCVVAFRGRQVTTRKGNIAPYDEWDLGKPEPSMNNLPTGKDGVIYSTKFFTRDFVDLNTALELAPTADDLWIKWHCALNGSKSMILNPEACTSDYKSFPVVDYSASYRDISLFKAHNSNASGNRNDVSIKKLEEYFLDRYGYNFATLCMDESAL